MCESDICNVLSLVNQPPDTLEDVHTMQTAAKYILCSVAAVQQFRQSCVIAKCSAEKPYFSHMSNDALGCDGGMREPTCHLGTTSRYTRSFYTFMIHLYNTLA